MRRTSLILELLLLVVSMEDTSVGSHCHHEHTFVDKLREGERGRELKEHPFCFITCAELCNHEYCNKVFPLVWKSAFLNKFTLP